MSLNYQLDRKVIQGTGIADLGRTTGSLKTESSAHATDVITGYDLNGNVIATAYNGIVQAMQPIYVYKYNFATDGGAVGAITLKGVGKVAAKNAITKGQLWWSTAGTSGGSATLSFGCAGSAVNLLAATAIATIGAAGGKAMIPIEATVATWVDTGATESDVTMTIGTAALTAGAFTLVLFGIPYTADTSS